MAPVHRLMLVRARLIGSIGSIGRIELIELIGGGNR